MHTQVTCPNCQTPYTAEVHQVVDASKNPELKQRLLNGQLNVAVCPTCSMGGQMATALLFHDPAHELFMIHVPQELNLDHMERERLIGQLSQQAMNDLPAEERRAYMLQPQMMLSMQSFMEKVLETEGITPEMIARQRQQAELLGTLAQADKDVVTHLIKERADEIDETFFAMLQAYLDAASQANDNKQLLALTNLRAKLMVETPVGRKLEKQQMALHALNRDAKKQDGLTPAILLKHVLANQDDPETVDALIGAGRGALTYSFFSLLSGEIEKQDIAGKQAAVGKLTALRERLLKIYDSMQLESQRILSEADKTLQTMLSAPDREAAVLDNLQKVDEAFMYWLSAKIAEADQKEDVGLAQALNEIHAIILRQVESQFPPEVMLLNQLLEVESPTEREQVLKENPQLLSPNLLKMVEAVMAETQEAGQAELTNRLQAIKQMIEVRL
jgi:hypothetical protein